MFQAPCSEQSSLWWMVKELDSGDFMTPSVLRHLWLLVDNTQSSVLLNLDDTSLVYWLLHQLRMERSLDHDETDLLSSYIRSRLPLIRDVAQGR